MHQLNRLHPLEKAVQLRDDLILEREIPLLVEHEGAETFVGDGLVVLQSGQQLIHPGRDHLVGLGEEALLLATDQIGESEVVLLALFRRENHLIIRRIDGVLFDLRVLHPQPELTKPLDEDVVFLLEGFEDVLDHFFTIYGLLPTLRFACVGLIALRAFCLFEAVQGINS